MLILSLSLLDRFWFFSYLREIFNILLSSLSLTEKFIAENAQKQKLVLTPANFSSMSGVKLAMMYTYMH